MNDELAPPGVTTWVLQRLLLRVLVGGEAQVALEEKKVVHYGRMLPVVEVSWVQNG